MLSIPEITLFENPPVGFYFAVTFFIGGFVPNLFDIRFQKVSGITSTIEMKEVEEGGEHLFVHRVPSQIVHGNLILERGLIIGSPLYEEFNLAMNTLCFTPGNVLVMLLNENHLPIANWLFQETYPVKWSISDLDANQNAVVIETIELRYSRLQRVTI